MRKRMLAPMILAGALWASPASALPYWESYCVTGSFAVCASVRITVTGDVVNLDVWNLAGLMGDAHTMTAMGLYYTDLSALPSMTDFEVSWMGGGTGGTDVDVTPWWTEKGANDIKTLAGVSTVARAGTLGADGIVGCMEVGSGQHWWTCLSWPDEPYMQFRFTFSGDVTKELAMRWHSQQLPDGSSVKCDTEGYGDYGPCNVIPEPFTIALLGTGLAGIGGIGALRRRRKGHDVVDG